MSRVEEQIQEFVLAVLTAERARLDADLVEAVRLQDPGMVDRLHVVSVAKPWGAAREFWHGLQSPNARRFEIIVADEVGWAASFVGRPDEDETDPGVERAARALQDRYENWTWSLDRWREIARLVLAEAGEAETPCATCGGVKLERVAWLRNGKVEMDPTPESVPLYRIKEPCPDCGVEIPDAAVEAGARAFYEWACASPGEPSRWDEPPGHHRTFARARAQVILDAAIPKLIAEGWIPSGTADAK